ncbi:ABC transporter substrate-binding protein [Microvirga pudoricolor]|uniref:ABC transporter substrate-binding protein n=1 Tax=Microvirga pudoricolor TaxID=2778729 RepID=UPI0019501C1B|nr:ABC transporter substrate-binding protein [Microvirga pudoricolor]MBM6593155.1 ABC transporter substrate-binding protein [Microvirga pudoricolor]
MGIRRCVWIGSALAVLALTGTASSAETVKVGVIGPFSGPFAGSFGTPFRQGVETYVAQHGEPSPDIKIEWIFKDLPQTDPQKSRAIAQELIVKDKVQYLAGFVFTPNALAVAPLASQAKIPTVIFNASASAVVSKSDYFVRTSNTLPQVTIPVAKNALKKGIRRVVTAVADYGPGVDSEAAFKKTFEAGGGQVVEAIRMPLNTTDFTPILQRIRAQKPDGLFVFLPYGPPTYSFVKAYYENGLKKEGIAFLGTSETQETDLQEQGQAALGLETGYHYSAVHPSAENKAFVAALTKTHPGAVSNPAAVAAYDGTHVLYEMIKATGGKPDPDKAIQAVKGLAWTSPRGPIRIDPATRDIVQNVYMRVVEKDPASGLLINRETETYEAQADPGVAP